MSRLTELIKQVEQRDPQLAADIHKEFDALSSRRAFGLNFERHMPETVELPGRPVRRGDKVRRLPERGETKAADNRIWRVKAVTRAATGRLAELVPHSATPEGEDETITVACDDLVVVAEFRDPIYPGLVSTGKVERGGDKPFHTVINAENFHALQTLLYTHEGKVDAIYIDPPYNTGNEGWIYNDKYVADEDAYKHSKWLAFMERRLLLARRLLAPTGVIIVAIGDDEHHRLRMLMDQVFGPQNFIANVAWQGGVSALAKHHGGGIDYMLIYGADASRVRQFRDPKPFAPEMLEAVAGVIDGGGSTEEAQVALKKFIKSCGKEIAPGLATFNKVDSDGEIYLEGDLANSLPRPNLRYPITNPETGRTYDPPANGWEVGPDKMQALIDAGRVVFGTRNVPARKKLLREHMDQLPAPSFYKDRRSGSQHVRRILGDNRFPFPKDYTVVLRWLRMVAPKDGIVIDFFGGSGTTCEAVMRLNEEDNGRRRCILVTNNEVASKDAKKLRDAGARKGDAEWEQLGVYEYVARPRIETVASGIRQDGSNYSEGLEQNVEFFTLTYESPRVVAHNRAFERIAPLLWLRAGAEGRRIDKISDDFDVADTYGVLFDLDSSREFIEAMSAVERCRIAYIVTDDDRSFQMVCNALPAHIEPVRLYESYLTNFMINAGVDDV